jgi:hypothetical protein
VGRPFPNDAVDRAGRAVYAEELSVDLRRHVGRLFPNVAVDREDDVYSASSRAMRWR